MNFEFSEKVKDLQRRRQAFLDEYIYPNEQRRSVSFALIKMLASESAV